MKHKPKNLLLSCGKKKPLFTSIESHTRARTRQDILMPARCFQLTLVMKVYLAMRILHNPELCMADAASEQLETGSSRSGGGADASSLGGGKQGMLVAVRCMEVGLVGEKGSKVPNFAVQELSLEMDFQLSLSWTYSP